MGRRRRKSKGTDDINLWAPIMGLVLLALLWLAWQAGMVQGLAEFMIRPLYPEPNAGRVNVGLSSVLIHIAEVPSKLMRS